MWIAGAVLLAGGCAGYQVGARSLFPQDIQTVYVPVFDSTSFRPYLGERLTEAVIKEIESRTPYKVVGAATADSILSGRVVSDRKQILVQSQTDEPRQFEMTMVVQVSWVDRNGAYLRDSEPVNVPPEVVELIRGGTAIPEVGQSVATAQQQSIERLAAQIVSLMEAPW